MKAMAPRADSTVAFSPPALAGVVPQVHGALRLIGDFLEALDHLLDRGVVVLVDPVGADEAVDREHVGVVLDHELGQRPDVRSLRSTSPERSCRATLILISPLAMTIRRSPMSAGVNP